MFVDDFYNETYGKAIYIKNFMDNIGNKECIRNGMQIGWML